MEMQKGRHQYTDGNADSLTRLADREQFHHIVGLEMLTSHYYRSPLALLAIVPEQFAEVREQHGQQFSDAVLSRIALIIKGELRSRDYLGRYGKDYFAVLLPETAIKGAEAVTKRMNRILNATVFGDLDHKLSLTFSIGVAFRSVAIGSFSEQFCEEAIDACIIAQSLSGSEVIADISDSSFPFPGSLKHARTRETACSVTNLHLS